MQLEFHQLDRRWEHLRVRHPARQRRLLASLAEVGQQTPIVVTELKAKAEETGCDAVMPRSVFSMNLPQILQRHAGAE